MTYDHYQWSPSWPWWSYSRCFFFSRPLHSGASSGLLCLRHFPGSSSSSSSLLPLPLLSSILPSSLSSPQGLRHHRHHRRRLSRVYHLPPKGSLHHHKHHYHIACHRINIMAMIICHDNWLRSSRYDFHRINITSTLYDHLPWSSRYACRTLPQPLNFFFLVSRNSDAAKNIFNLFGNSFESCENK